MMKYENGKPISNKFVDFQCYDYKSPAIDLLNFLLTSVNTDVLKEEFDGLLKFYHSEFVDNLKKMGCDIEPFKLVFCGFLVFLIIFIVITHKNIATACLTF